MPKTNYVLKHGTFYEVGEELMHWKYIKRERKNGKWVYYYHDDAVENAKNALSSADYKRESALKDYDKVLKLKPKDEKDIPKWEELKRPYAEKADAAMREYSHALRNYEVAVEKYNNSVGNKIVTGINNRTGATSKVSNNPKTNKSTNMSTAVSKLAKTAKALKGLSYVQSLFKAR